MTTTMFMMTSIGIGAVLGVLAWLAERGLRAEGRPGRWAWVAAMALTVAIPFLPRLMPTPGVREAAAALPATALSAERLASLLEGVSSNGIAIWTERVFAALWVGSSVVALLVALVAVARLWRARRHWAEAEIQERRVRLSRRFGPAVVGLVRPDIVLPRSALDLHAQELALVLEHEQQHVRARDPWLLALATVMIIALPWNVALVWQALRLRRAVELDCDQRVLARGAGRRSYADLLVRMAADTPSFPFAFAALSERRSFLRDRLEAMRSGANAMGGYTRVALVVAITAGLVGIFAFAPRFVTVEFSGHRHRLERLKIDTELASQAALEARERAFMEQARAKAALEESLARVQESMGRIELTQERMSERQLRLLQDKLEAQREMLRAQEERLRVEQERLDRLQVELEGRLREADGVDGSEPVARFRFRERVQPRVRLAPDELKLPGIGARFDTEGRPFLYEARESDPRLEFPPPGLDTENGPLVLIDGERVDGSAKDVLAKLSPDRIDRVEVIKGDAARTVHGDDAKNGVIQIFLKKN